MIQLRKLRLAHNLRAIKQPDGREADGFYEFNSTGVFLRDRNDVPFAFIHYVSGMIESVEPCQGHAGRYRGLHFLTGQVADRIGIDRDTDDLGQIAHDFLYDVGVTGIRDPIGNMAFVLLYSAGRPITGEEPYVFQCEASDLEDATRQLVQNDPDRVVLYHVTGRDVGRAIARWQENSVAKA